MVIDEAVAPYVRMIFAWAMSGVRRLEIAQRLELIGAPTPATHGRRENVGNHWTDSCIKQILHNPAYAGFHVMGKSKVSLYRGISGHRTKRDEWIYFPDFHEPYITMEEHKYIEALLDRIKKEREERMAAHEEARKRMPDVFQGMVYCADCGRQMSFARGSHHRGSDGLSFSYYRCRMNKSSAKCTNKMIQQNFLKIIVMDQIRVLIGMACDKNKILRMIKGKTLNQESADHVRRNIIRLSERERELDDKILKAYVDHADGSLNSDEYRMVRKKLMSDKETVIHRKEGMEKKQTEMEMAIRRYQDMAEGLERFLAVKEFDEKLVKELVRKIWVGDDGSVSIEFNCQDVFAHPLVDEYISENAGGE